MDKEKFISIIKENQRLIYKVCFTYCSNKEHRKDLEQEILVQLWKSMARFDGRVKISTWIYQVALNTAFLFYRNERRHIGKMVSFDDSILSIAEHDPEPELEDNIAMLYKFISNLDELDKALMILFLDNNKYRDIATILGITETNVATKIGRIKNKLRDFFNNNQ